VLHITQETREVVGGAIEVDRSYFGGTRKGKRGRGAAGISRDTQTLSMTVILGTWTLLDNFRERDG
jgi:hypothetical protein